MRVAIIFGHQNSKLSYNDDWKDAFINSKQIKVDTYNGLYFSKGDKIKISLLYDYIILLHSTNSNGFKLPFGYIQKNQLNYRRGKLIVFVGNEYKLMPQKIKFLKNNNADFIISQLPQKTAEWLYDGTNCRVISLPHALNPNVFYPTKKAKEKNIDIGNRSYPYPVYLGDIDRNRILNFTNQLQSENKLKINVSYDPEQRLNRKEWARFLNDCKFTIATEAGSSFLERDDRTRLLVIDYLNKYPESSFNEIYNVFFSDYKNPVSGKCISSRHFDAIGTKTCQILLEGNYNNILIPGEHYIELKKDLSNADNVLSALYDQKSRDKMVNRSFEYAMELHTHQKRIEYLLNFL